VLGRFSAEPVTALRQIKFLQGNRLTIAAANCLDLAPDTGGRAGQIIVVRHEQTARPLVAGSLTEWLDLLAVAQGG
jgi:cell wall assembly regulator SMI1